MFRKYEHLSVTPHSYVAMYTQDSVVIDGKDDDEIWKSATWTELFRDIEGDIRPVPKYRTQVKMAWDDQYLYVFAALEEPHVWANVRNHDEVVFHDNDFEVFMDPDGDSQHYFEIEVNALNTIFDLFLPKPYRDGGSALIPWHASDLRSAIHIDGTINDPGDIDKKWSVELAIPFKNLTLGNHVRVPKHGEHWRINFSRVEWEFDLNGKSYERKRNPTTNEILPEYNWVWSPQGVINMHYPERWGYLFFSNQLSDGFDIPSSHNIKNLLWLGYYKQKDIWSQKKRYAKSLRELDIPAKTSIDGITYQITCECSERRFLMDIINPANGERWSIDEKGVITHRPAVNRKN